MAPVSIERQYRGLRETISGVGILLSEEGVILECIVNDRTREFLYDDLESLVGNDIWTLFPDAQAQRFGSVILDAVESGSVQTIEYEMEVQQGTRYFRGTVTPVEDEGGSDAAVLWFAEDVTEQKERKRDLELFRTLVNEAQDAFFVLDPDTGRILDVNATACDRLGYDREELLELSIWEVSTKFEGRADFETFCDRNRERDLSAVPTEHVRADGTTVPVVVSSSFVTVGGQDYRIAIARETPDPTADFVYELDAEESPSKGVIVAVSTAEAVDPIDIRPLHEVIDPERLDALLEARPQHAPVDSRSISFRYEGYDVSVRATGLIELTRTRAR